jgi:hypothetical protein
MLVQIVDKQRRAVSVVKTALNAAGLRDRTVCVTVDSWFSEYGKRDDYAVFVGSPLGVDAEPFYVTGGNIVEAVKKMLDFIKGRANDAKAVVSKIAPF